MRTKVLSVLLAVALLLSMLPAAFATDTVACPGENETHTKDNCSCTVLGTVPASCEEIGYTRYQCTGCENVFIDDITAALGGEHQLEGGKEVKAPVAPSCETEGKTAIIECTVCHREVGGVAVPAIGHKIEADADGNAVWYKDEFSCVAPAYRYNKCLNDNCDHDGIVNKEQLEGSGDGEHTWMIDQESIVAPEGLEDGSATWYCKDCGVTKFMPILNGHLCAENLTKVEAVAATCNTLGNNEYYICSCGKVYKADKVTETTVEAERITEYAHNYAVDPTLIPAGCESWGFKIYACMTCGKYEVIEGIKPTGHDKRDAKGVVVSETAATCEKDGKYTWSCHCGKALEEIIPATGHNEKSVTVDATCKTYGYEYTYCVNDNCDAESVASAEVDGAAYDVSVDGNAVRLLDITVGKELDGDNHMIEEGTINAATCTKDGSKVGYCVYCNEYATEVLPAVGHKAPEGDLLRVEPTCVAAGYTYFICDNDGCDAEIVVETLPYEAQGEYTYEQACVAHNIEDADAEIFREGTCRIVGLEKYWCSDCEEYVFVVIDNTGKGHVEPDWSAVEIPDGDGDTVDMSVPGQTETLNGVVFIHGKDATCTENGCTSAYICLACGDYVESEVLEAPGSHDHSVLVSDAVSNKCREGKTAVYKCSRCDDVIGGETLPAVHNTAKFDAVEATCTTSGNIEYSVCSDCDAVFDADGDKIEAGSTVIPALGHDYSRVVVTDATCTAPGFTTHWCTACEDNYATDYTDAIGHAWAEEPVVTEADCENAGSKIWNCENDCGETKTEELPALGHKNAAGETLVDCCTDTPTDRLCVNCDQEIGKNHVEVTTTVAATCLEYGYTLTYCAVCLEETKDIVIDDTKLGGHVWGEWTEVTAPTVTSKGSEKRVCSVCGGEELRDTDALDGLIIALDADNAVVSGAGYADSSLVALTVTLKSSKTDIWKLMFNVEYDPSVVTYEKIEFVSDSFINNPVANDNGGYVTVMAGAPNTVDGKTQNITVEGEEVLAVLYFRVSNAEATEASFAIGEAPEVTDKDSNMFSDEAVMSEGADIEILRFLDINKDGDVNIVDTLAAYKIAIGESDVYYDVTVDVDRDGEITIADYVIIDNYLIGALTYDELVGRA